MPTLRPVIYGVGIDDALALYIDATATTGDEYAIVGFTMVLEHVLGTVVRQDSASEIRKKLQSSRVLAADADFISELEDLVVTHAQTYRKDSQALGLTVETCCESTELARHAPPHLQLSRLSEKVESKDRKKALAELAACISATRNEVVHAKLNYQATGKECPREQYRALAQTVLVAAEQSIRWLAALPDHARITRTT